MENAHNFHFTSVCTLSSIRFYLAFRGHFQVAVIFDLLWELALYWLVLLRSTFYRGYVGKTYLFISYLLNLKRVYMQKSENNKRKLCREFT